MLSLCGWLHKCTMTVISAITPFKHSCIRTYQNSSAQGPCSLCGSNRESLSLFHLVSTPPASSGNATKWLGDGRNTTRKSIYLKGCEHWRVGRFALITYQKVLERLVLPGCFSIFLQWDNLGEKAGFICNVKHLGIRHMSTPATWGPSTFSESDRHLQPSSCRLSEMVMSRIHSLILGSPSSGRSNSPLLSSGCTGFQNVAFQRKKKKKKSQKVHL